jgi:hypothetical protein
VFAVPHFVRQTGPDGIQIDIDEACRHGPLVQQPQKPLFNAHRIVAEGVEIGLRGSLRHLAGAGDGGGHCQRAPLQPASGDLLGGPLGGAVGSIPQHGVQMVVHQTESLDIDRHDRSQKHRAVLQPDLVMPVRPLGERGPTTEHRPVDTAIDAEVARHFVRIKQELARQTGHGKRQTRGRKGVRVSRVGKPVDIYSLEYCMRMDSWDLEWTKWFDAL